MSYAPENGAASSPCRHSQFTEASSPTAELLGD